MVHTDDWTDRRGDRRRSRRRRDQNYIVGPPPEDFAGRIDESVSVEVTALWAFALAAAAAGLVIVYQAMGRHAADLARAAGSSARSLGFTRRGPRRGIGAARWRRRSSSESLGADRLAVALSPLFPEGWPGGPILLRGCSSTGRCCSSADWRSSRSAWRSPPPAVARRRRDVNRGATVTAPAPLDRLAASLSPAAGLGFRFALCSHGAGGAGRDGPASPGPRSRWRGCWPWPPSIDSAERLMTTPRLYGAGWDPSLGIDPDDDVDAVVEAVAADPDVAAVGRQEMLHGRLRRATATGPGGSGRVEPEVFDAVIGAIAPTLTEGRLPRGPSEVAIGDRWLARLGADLGDTIEVDGRRGPVDVRCRRQGGDRRAPTSWATASS